MVSSPQAVSTTAQGEESLPCSDILPSHRRQFSTDLPCINPSHGLQCFMDSFDVGLFPQGAVLQSQPAPAWVPCRVISLARKSAPAWPPLSMGLQVPARSLLQHRIAMGSQPPFSHPPALTWVSSMGCRWNFHPCELPWSASQSLHPCVLHGLQGWSCFTTVFTQAAEEPPLRCLVLH